MIIGPGISLQPGISVLSLSTIPPLTFYSITATLSSSLIAYNSAPANQAVPITAAEYSNLQLLVGNTQTSMTDAGIGVGYVSYVGGLPTGTMVIRQGTSYANGSPPPPAWGNPMIAGYVYAFKVVWRPGGVVVPPVYIGYGVTTSSVGVSISSAPATTVTADTLAPGGYGYTYYVIKAPTNYISTSGYYPTLWMGTSTTTRVPINFIRGSGWLTSPAPTISTAPTSNIGTFQGNWGFQFLQTTSTHW